MTDLYERDAAKQQELQELRNKLKGDMEAEFAETVKYFR